LNLPTPEEKLTSKIAKEADMILVMSVPMGLCGQKYHKEATGRLRVISKRFPDKIIEVDGGINPETIVEALRAGANIAVVGSYITLSDNPLEALLKIDNIIESLKGRISP
ncbi:MAG: ribulose-phosphate 3-epimerase, partial [Candidatus Bathyarchaeia archaeon]